MTDHLAEARRDASRLVGHASMPHVISAIRHLADAIEQIADAVLADSDPGPWHIVSRRTGRHHGPFTTEHDALMARALAGHITVEWRDAVTMDREDFAHHLHRSNVGGVLS